MEEIPLTDLTDMKLSTRLPLQTSFDKLDKEDEIGNDTSDLFQRSNQVAFMGATEVRFDKS